MLSKGKPEKLEVLSYAYRPFDTRWLYWQAEHNLLDRPRPEYKPHLQEGNLWLSAAQHLRKGETEPQAYLTRNLASYHLIERGALWFPAWLHEERPSLDGGGEQRRPNLSDAAQRYLDRLGLGVEDLFHHVLAVLHDPARTGRPTPAPSGWSGLASRCRAGRTAIRREPRRSWQHRRRGAGNLPRCLTRRRPSPGVTTGGLRPEIAAIAVPSTTDGGNMADR